jgi:cytoskeleton protein RodZ
MADIGDTLREARMRARIDVSEIEAKTKIRAKYLRALENEEWSLLPGPTFVKSFLRTYAQALGLDGKALVEQYRLEFERPAEAALEPIVPPSQRTPNQGSGARPARGPSRAYVALVGVVLLLIVLLIVGLLGGSSKHGGHKGPAAARSGSVGSNGKGGAAPSGGTRTGSTSSAVVSLSLQASARVYVCLIGDGGRKVIGGTELAPGAVTPTYHAHRFRIVLGNSSVTMRVDGIARTVPPSSEPIGYSIRKAYGRKRLSQSQLPSCT